MLGKEREREKNMVGSLRHIHKHLVRDWWAVMEEKAPTGQQEIRATVFSRRHWHMGQRLAEVVTEAILALTPPSFQSNSSVVLL